MSSSPAKLAAESKPDLPMIRFAGHMFEPLPSGALFWRSRETLLVADLHLEKLSSFARRGQFLPPYDTGMTLLRLEADLQRTRARHLVALGDSFHRDEGTKSLQPTDRARLDRLMARTDWTWISGNHDPSPHALGGTCAPEAMIDGVTLCHEPGKSRGVHVAGHLHPAARLSINGRSVRAACFVADDRLMILPAYGSSTGSLNILSPAFAGLLNLDRMQVVMTGRDRVFAVSPRRLVGG